MKKVLLLLSLIPLFVGCASTTISYKTPRVDSVPMNKVANGDIELKCKSNFMLYGHPTADHPGFSINHVYEKRFNDAFANAVKKSRDFQNVSISLLQEDSPSTMLFTKLSVEPSSNFITGVFHLLSLGLIPHYTELDYNFDCEFRKDGKKYYYQFCETTSTWQGLLVVGKALESDREQSQKKVFENISNNLIRNLRHEKVIAK